MQQRRQRHLCVQHQRQGHLRLHNVEVDLHLHISKAEVRLHIVEVEVSLALLLHTEVMLVPLLEVMLDLLLPLTQPQLAPRCLNAE